MKKKKQARLDKFVSFLCDKSWTVVAIITLLSFVAVTAWVLCSWPHGVLTGILVVLFGGILAPAQFATILVAAIISIIDFADRRDEHAKKN